MTAVPFSDNNSAVDVSPPVAAQPVAPDQCANCDTALVGPCCHQCGEPRFDPTRLTTRHFVRHTAHELADYDSRTLATVRALITKPGSLTAEYLRGRNRSFLGPLRVYLAAFAAMLLASAMFRPLKGYDVDTLLRLGGGKNGPALLALIGRIAARKHTDVATFTAQWSAHWAQYAVWSELLNALLFAVVIAVLFRRRQRDFAEHLIFSLHALAFGFLLAIVFLPVQWAVGIGAGSIQLVSGVYVVLFATYLYFAFRRMYMGSRRSAAVKAAIGAIGGQVVVIVVYYLALFAALFRTMRS